MANASLRDQIALLDNPARLRLPAFAVIDKLDHMRPGEQVMGTALALVVMCEAAGIPLSDVISKAERMCAPAEGPFTAHIQTIRDYAKGELK